MKKMAITSLAVALLGFSAPGVSAAPTNLFSFTKTCGGQNFATCMSGSIGYEYIGGNTVVTISVTNLGENDELFKAVGLINIQTALPTFTSGPTGYAGPPPNDLNGGGLPGDVYAAVTNSQADMLAFNETGNFAFTFSGELDLDDLQALGIGVHAISGPIDLSGEPGATCSTKAGVLSGGVVDNADLEAYANCSTTVPEPASMFLFGAGMVGFLATRRRRNALELD